ncbi:hypothetical protein OS493_023473 [Desmophyllum pertusum]|uniref:Carboxylesterase type B domain-containing protein n=1 Tax=Desmophyllum pertusum TaxID=174260 RepID=A0A9W9ZMP6_9CNID|nr:hypothetical protein OS493_023473 [Desmophyllum pertusum]
MSVGLLLLSPLSKDLFHQAIAESGVDLRPSATQPVSYGLRFAKELAQKLDCTTSDHEAMVGCIRKKEGRDIQNAADTISFQHAPVYLYEFAHRSVKASIYPEWMGVPHFENVLYDFGIPLFPTLSSNYDAADRNVSLFIMAVYAKLRQDRRSNTTARSQRCYVGEVQLESQSLPAS